MFEVGKPPLQREVDLFDNRREAMSTRSSRFLPDDVLQLLQALFPGPSSMPPEMITQKVEPVRMDIHNPRSLSENPHLGVHF